MPIKKAKTTTDILIIGTGFGGLCMAIQLKKAGMDHFIMLEKAAGVGGTWRDNTYPGAACDIQSHLYSFSFEPKSDWSRKFPQQPEILSYLEGCADKYELRPHIRLNAEVVSAAFDETHARWTVTTRQGETFQAKCVITACGQLNRPAYANIEGLEQFQGKVFHSARWDHDYDLSGKAVAVLGTGASAIQFVPAIVDSVSRLTLFQRSGAWVIPKPDRSFTALEQFVFEKLPLTDRAYRGLIYLKNESNALAFTQLDWLLEGLAWRSRRQARRRVRDAAKRRKLTPDYKIGCKRILLSGDWFPAMDRDHVEVVTEAISHVTADAVVMKDGHRHPVDAIIHGTGFQATDFLAPMTITGLGGIELNEAWRDGAEAYKGICVSGFPNLFMLYGPNTNLGHNSIVFMLESQVHYILQCIDLLRGGDVRFMNVRAERQRDYVARIQEQLSRTVWDSGCSSWYKTASGKNTNNWPGFTFMYRWSTRRLDPQDFELHRTVKTREPVEA